MKKAIVMLLAVLLLTTACSPAATDPSQTTVLPTEQTQPPSTEPPVTQPPATTPPFEAVYEAEDAQFFGSNHVETVQGASGSVVCPFSGSDDSVVFTVAVDTDGVYDLTFVSQGIGGDKINNILVDEQYAGEFSSTASGFSEDTVHGVLLTAGEHTVAVTPSWGWIYLDQLKVTGAEGISNEVYQVDPTLINPNANEDAKQLFSYLCESYGKTTLAGQVCDYGLSGPECQAIYEITGKYPALIGFDMMDHTPSRNALGARGVAVDQAIRFHKEGGIVTFCWHWNAPTEYLKSGSDSNGNPRWWGGFYTDNTNFDISAVMNGSDPKGKELLDRDIAHIASLFNKLEQEGVPVLWRPLHEASGGWFWWGAKGAEPYKKLWIYLYEELTFTYGCNNLIWVWNGQAPDWYPGDEYVDIIGEDIYANARSYVAHNSKFSELLDHSGTNKIIAMTENGVVFDIEQAVITNARWAWFCTWCGDFVQKNGVYSEQYTQAEMLKKVYDSEYVITLDELPDFG